MYYTYMIRCRDNSIYTGITTNLERRMFEHFEKNEKCAKYTKKHEFKNIEVAWESENRAIASKLEYNIKLLKKQQKEFIIKDNNKFKDFLEQKIEFEQYTRVSEKVINNINSSLVNKNI